MKPNKTDLHEKRLDTLDESMARLLVIAENHTVQIGILMKVFFGGAGLVGLSVLALIMAKVGLPLYGH